MSVQKIFNILIVGDHGVGKSTYLKRIYDGSFEKFHIPTVDEVKITTNFNTNYGEFTLNFYEIPQVDLNSFSKNVDVVIIMFGMEYSANVNNWLTLVRERFSVGLPVILCGNKCDVKGWVVKESSIFKFASNNNCMYSLISAKSNYNFDEPVLKILRNLTNNLDLVLLIDEEE